MREESVRGGMVQEYYVARLREIAARRAEARAAVRTRGQALRLREEVRRKLRAIFGPFPPRTPLNARVTGVLNRGAYRIEKIIYESRPSLPVTANLYVPSRAATPMPAVLAVCGHSGVGKAEPNYQRFVQFLARQGYLVLILDPLSQGERLQFIGCRRGDALRGCCDEHNMMGNPMHLVGDFFGTWRVWDAIRGLDLLLSRPEADRTRVGVTGNSGGGTLTTYVNGLDDRPTMAAPSCFVTTYLRDLENELPADSEQIPPGILAAGLDQADFFIAQAPRPTLLLGQKNDYFDPRGTRETFEEVRRVYALLGAEKNVEMFVGPRGHGYFQENREAMYRFFHKHAGVARPARERNLIVEKPADLAAAPRGQVHWLRPSPRRAHDFTRDRANELATMRGRVGGAKLRAALIRRLQLPRRAGAPPYRILRTQTPRKGLLDSPFLLETEPGCQAVLHVFSPKEAFFHLPAAKSALVYVPDISATDDALKGRAPRAGLLFAVDPRGIGRTWCRTAYDDADFFRRYGTDYFYASHGMMLDESYAGRRVQDILCALDLLAANGCAAVHLVGRGLGAVYAAFAACLHPLVKQATLQNALLSYHELTQTPVTAWPLSCLVRNALKDFDLPDCYRALAAEKRLRLAAPWDALRRPWKAHALRAHLKELGLERVPVRLR